MMEPIGLSTRRDGEQMLIHQCRGCGVIRHNRVAADDNVIATMRLPVVTVDARDESDEEIAGRTA
jgi:hypothetical protein